MLKVQVYNKPEMNFIFKATGRVRSKFPFWRTITFFGSKKLSQVWILATSELHLIKNQGRRRKKAHPYFLHPCQLRKNGFPLSQKSHCISITASDQTIVSIKFLLLASYHCKWFMIRIWHKIKSASQDRLISKTVLR